MACEVTRFEASSKSAKFSKGLFITTGSFSRDAVKEATRDGAPPLDLIDGDQLAEMLKELRLGISVQTVEKVVVDSNWFRSI